MKMKFKRILGASGITLSAAAAVLSCLAITKKKDSQYANEPEEMNPFEGKKVIFIADANDKENADGVKGHLEAVGESVANNSLYEKYGKRALDRRRWAASASICCI